MDAIAKSNPEISFIWISAEDENKISEYTDSLTYLRFVNDKDSVIWKEFNPTGWGIGYAFGDNGNLLWHGYTSELTDEILSSVLSGSRVERKSYTFGVEYTVAHKVGFGEYSTSVIPHEDGQEWRFENKPITSLIGMLVRGIYGNDVKIISLGAERAATPISFSVRFHYAEGEWKSTFRRFLNMLCGGYNIQMSFGDDREEGLTNVVVIDYTGYSG
jgi:hypothetical protein